MSTEFYKVFIAGQSSRVMQSTEMRIYPNPAQDLLSFELWSDVSEQVDVVVTDISGKIVLRTNRILEEGDNYFDIQVGELGNGMYIVTLKSENILTSERISIVK